MRGHYKAFSANLWVITELQNGAIGDGASGGPVSYRSTQQGREGNPTPGCPQLRLAVAAGQQWTSAAGAWVKNCMWNAEHYPNEYDGSCTRRMRHGCAWTPPLQTIEAETETGQ